MREDNNKHDESPMGKPANSVYLSGKNQKKSLRMRESPYTLLTQYERDIINFGSLSKENQKNYSAVIDVLRQNNDVEKHAKAIQHLAESYQSEGAARALYGTPIKPIRRKMVLAVERFLAMEVEYSLPIDDYRTNVWPLALAGTTSDKEVDVLCRAALHQGKKGLERVNQVFRSYAVRALAESDYEVAQKALISLLAELSDKVTRQSAVEFASEHPTDFMLKTVRELLAMPRRHAIYRLAHEFQGQGKIAATLSSTLGRWRYRRVFADFKKIIQKAN